MSKTLQGIAITLVIIVLIYRPNSAIEMSIILGLSSVVYLLIPDKKKDDNHVI